MWKMTSYKKVNLSPEWKTVKIGRLVEKSKLVCTRIFLHAPQARASLFISKRAKKKKFLMFKMSKDDGEGVVLWQLLIGKGTLLTECDVGKGLQGNVA